jgi:transposase
VYYKFVDDYITIDVFCDVIKEIKDKLQGSITGNISNRAKSYTVYLDNAPSHTAKDTIKYCTTNSIPCITPPPYSSELNLAELVFRHLKNISYKINYIDE